MHNKLIFLHRLRISNRNSVLLQAAPECLWGLVLFICCYTTVLGKQHIAISMCIWVGFNIFIMQLKHEKARSAALAK